jgi:NADPH:quinone reductase-like Zn-dependent oxidoreductase
MPPPTFPSAQPLNSAAWMSTALGQLEVGAAPYTPPGDQQIVVRNHAVAVNPLEWIIQVAGPLVYRWLEYPAVIGSDVAGVVAEVGHNVTRFRVGDRVIGHAVGTDKDSNNTAEGAFQHYTVLLDRMACPIPDRLTFEEAVVLPLAVSTASCGLFQADQLGLDRPSVDPEPTGKTVLVWGGSTSVGTQAIQLAVAAGYDVITTCSPHNNDYVKRLGAVEAFDYNSPTVIADIVSAFAGRTFAGAIAFGTTSARSCLRIAARCEGNKFVALATPPVSFDGLAPGTRGRFATARTIRKLVTGNMGMQFYARPRGVKMKYIFGTSLKYNDISTAIYRDFLPTALDEGRYAAEPTPMVIGDGLEHLQRALDVQRTGVSAAKVVVALTPVS